MSSSTVKPSTNIGFDLYPLVKALSLPVSTAVKAVKHAPVALLNSAKTIGKAAILDAPQAVLDTSTHALAKTQSFAAANLKSLANFLSANTTPEPSTSPTENQREANLKQGKAITAQFTQKMEIIKHLSTIDLSSGGIQEIVKALKEYKTILETDGHTTLSGLFKAEPSNSEPKVDPETLETIALLLDETLPLTSLPRTHHVHHSTAPSWLALLLDGTYEPTHIEELASLIQTAAQEGLPPIAKEFQKTALEFTENPVGALEKGTTFKTIDSSIAYSVADIAASFLGILSVVRGYQEFKEGGHHLHSLNNEREQLKTDQKHINTLHKTLGENIPNGLMFQKLLNLSKLDRNKQGIHAAKIDRWIGLSAMGAGASSAIKGISDLGIKTGLALKSLASGHGLWGGAAIATKSTAAGIASSAAGLAGTLALGPLAGLFAVGLGLGFTRKTNTKLKQLQRDFPATTNDFKGIEKYVDPKLSKGFSEYQNFVSKEGQKRTRFFSHFSKWNKAFLVGAGLYTASAGAKAAIVGASLLGATAAASNPVGWGVLTGVGIAGGILVGIATLGFIKGHVRQTRYNQQTAGDHPLVDRHFLVNAQNFGRKGENGYTHYSEGLNLAAKNFEFLDNRQTSLKALLETAATATGSLAPHSNQLSVFQRMRGNTLGKTRFNTYLNEKGGFKTILDRFVTTDIEKQIQHIQNKLAFRLDIKDENKLSEAQLKQIAQQPNAQEALDSYASHLTRLASKTEQDTRRLIQLKATQEQLQTLRGEKDALLKTNQTDIKKLLLQHWGVNTTDKKGKALDVDKLFAKQMVRTLSKEVDMAKGVLFEAQLEASHMNSLTENSQTSSSKGGANNSRVTTHKDGKEYNQVAAVDPQDESKTPDSLSSKRSDEWVETAEIEQTVLSSNSDGEIHTAPSSPRSPVSA
jgi:hypothetical protein